MGLLLLWVIRLLFAALRSLPITWSVALLSIPFRLLIALSPRYRAIALKNIALAFPQQTEQERLKILQSSCTALGRLLADSARLTIVDAAWVSQHVEQPSERAQAFFAANAGRGVIVATGHLGSFELAARTYLLRGRPLDFVVRDFTVKEVDDWWRKRREQVGARVISRKGALKGVLRALQHGRDVGILFDQNITANYATFVPFFGMPAATTKVIGLAAVRMECPIVVHALVHIGGDYYRPLFEPCEVSDIYADQSLSGDDKIHRVTERVSKIYEEMIREYPQQWFWIHRRWKTRPPGEVESFYSDLSGFLQRTS